MAHKRKRALTYGKQSQARDGGRATFQSLLSDRSQDGDTMGFAPEQWNTGNQPLQPRPASQKEATMSVEPSDDQVRQIEECLPGIDRLTARRYLKVKQNNLEQALNAILEGESIDKLEEGTSWDDALFSTDRDGGPGNDANLRPLGSSAAPTRGPSPAPSLGIKHPTTREDEDKELQAAIAASRGLPYQQETGVLKPDGSEVKFGPATKDFYEKGQWAMVTTSAATSEVVPDTDIQSRANVRGEPRLLKHLPDGDYSPNLLTILHSIPAARDALLLSQAVRPDYGQDPEWWHGSPIVLPRIVSVADGTSPKADSDKYDEIIAEMQRLMAFLDCSDRSYATIGGLTQTDAIKNNEVLYDNRSGTLMELMLQNWMVAASNQTDTGREMARRFRTLFGDNHDEDTTAREVSVVDLNVTTPKGQKSDLLELLDQLLWDTDSDDADPAVNFLERPAEILIMRLLHTSPSAKQLGVEVPAELYLDKYLKTNVASTRTLRRRIAEHKNRIAEIEASESRLMYHPHPKKSGERLDARLMLRHSLGHFNGQNRLAADNADGKIADAVDLPPHYSSIASRLEQLVIDIDAKLVQLAEEKDKVRKALSDMSKSPPPGLAADELQHRYSLRGVATKPNITYLLRPKEAVPEDEEMLLQSSEDATPPGMQWWRIDYDIPTSSSASATVSKTQTADYDVLRAAELEHSSALLVYASAQACGPDAYGDTARLPGPLQTFILRDNALFASDLAQEHDRPPAYEFDVPRPSIEARTSMDSTRVELDDDDDDQGHDAWPHQLEQHSSFGLGYGPKQDAGPPAAVSSSLADDDDDDPHVMVKEPPPPRDPPRVDIVLDDDDDDEDVAMRGTELQGRALATPMEDEQMQGAESQQR